MFVFVANRVLWSIPVMLLAILLSFGMMKAMPGGPFDRNPIVRSNAQLRHNLEAKYGLDKPWYQQYALFSWNALHGDFGLSYTYKGTAVRQVIDETLPVSIELGVLAFLFSMTTGVLLGVVSALRVNSWADYTITLLATLAFAVPSFVTASYWVRYMPSYYGWDDSWERVGPILVLGLTIMPYFTRLVRASMLETLQSDFITTARSKGLPYRTTVLRHMLRNSLIPVVTNAGPLFGFTITGSFIIEGIMGVPGMASNFTQSIQGDPRDDPMLLGATVVLAAIIIAMNLIVDLVVGFLDPRIAND
jgi:oligopeptide transport system permease protein